MVETRGKRLGHLWMRKLCERSGRYSFARCQPDRRYSADIKTGILRHGGI
jgi:hypothetical protein